MANALLNNLDKVQIPESAIQRISRNLGLDNEAVEPWCRRQIEDPDRLTKTDKTWNVRGDGFVLLIDVETLQVITARREKPKKGSDLKDVHIIRRLDDIPALKQRLIEAFDAKTHRRVARYGLLLADHVLELAGIPMDETIATCYAVNRRWQDGDAGFQEARDMAFLMHERARAEKNPVREKALRTLGQVAAIPHVKRHALIASDYAVQVVNLLYPGDLGEVERERGLQIRLMESV